MVDARAAHLLKTLIERYIAEGQPVGSRALSRQSGLELSPATVRNVMADLEEAGFIASPHTSAGRVPTPRGYRFFVDSLMVVQPLDAEARSRIEGELAAERSANIVASAATLVSQLTHFAGVVMTPRREGRFRHIELMRLSEHRVLMVIVTAEGDVQNRILHTRHGYTQAQLTEASNQFNHEFAGEPFARIRQRLTEDLARLRDDIAALMSAAVDAGESALASGDEVVLAGERNLLTADDFASNMGSLRKLFDVFERKSSLVHLLDSAQRAQGVKIFIGDESGMAPLDEMSVVTAPYEVNGRVLGTLGVIGPTRMAYERVIPIVEVTSKLLSSALAQQSADE